MSPVALQCLGYGLLAASIGLVVSYAVLAHEVGHDLAWRRVRLVVLVYLASVLGTLGIIVLLPSAWRGDAIAAVLLVAAFAGIASIIHRFIEQARLGSVLIDLGKTPRQGWAWVVLPFGVFYIALRVVDYGTNESSTLKLAGIIFWSAFMLNVLLTATSKNQVREHGIASIEGVVRWRNITRYQWNDGVLTLVSNRSRLFTSRQMHVRVPYDCIADVRQVLLEKVSWQAASVDAYALA